MKIYTLRSKEVGGVMFLLTYFDRMKSMQSSQQRLPPHYNPPT